MANSTFYPTPFCLFFSFLFFFFLFKKLFPPFFFSLLLGHNAQAARRPKNQPVNFKKHLSKKCMQVLKMPASSSRLPARGNVCCLPDCPRKRAGPQIPLKLFHKTVMCRRHRSTDTREPCFCPSPFFILFLSGGPRGAVFRLHKDQPTDEFASITGSDLNTRKQHHLNESVTRGVSLNRERCRQVSR